jgi:hypothetical protein
VNAPDPAELRGWLDKQAITEQLANYCRAVDRLDIPLGHAVFHEDGTADYGADLFQGSGRGVIDFICASHLHTINHSHQICNSIVALDGDSAGSETYFHSATRIVQDVKLIQIRVWGRYLDAWSRREGRWAIDRRRTIFDFDETRDVALTERHEQGARDHSDPSYTFLKGHS